jgi:DNA polymerase III alpha subunit
MDLYEMFTTADFISNLGDEISAKARSYKFLLEVKVNLEKLLNLLEEEGSSTVMCNVLALSIKNYMKTDVLELNIEENEYDFTLDNITDIELATKQLKKVSKAIIGRIEDVSKDFDKFLKEVISAIEGLDSPKV